MKPLLMIMLAAQAAIFLGAVFLVAFARTPAGRERPLWPGVVFGLVIVAWASSNQADRHEGQPGAEMLNYGATLLIGMAIMGALMAIRLRRGLDRG